jgi:Sodium/hydrogen exchanger family
MNRNERWVLAWGMNARGVMELVIADLALKKGFIGADLFSTLVLMGMITTLATPPLLERAFKRMEAKQALGEKPTLPDRREVAPELMHDLENRHDWARNASGTEAEAGLPQWRRTKAG